MKVIYDPNYHSLLKLSELKKGNVNKYSLLGKFLKYNFKNRPVIIFKNLKFNGKVVAKNIAMNFSKYFAQAGKLKPGDVLAFDAQLRKNYQYMRTPSGTPIAKYVSYKFDTPHHVKLLNAVRPSLTEDKLVRAGYTMLKSGTLSKDTIHKDPQFINKYLKVMSPKTKPYITRNEANDILRAFALKAVREALRCILDIVNDHSQKIKTDSSNLKILLSYMNYINNLPKGNPMSPDYYKHSLMDDSTFDTLSNDADFYRMNNDDFVIQVRGYTKKDFVNAYNDILNIMVYVANA